MDARALEEMGDLQALTAGAARVEYYDVGRGPALVMLHGGNCAATDWATILPRLSKEYRCILPDGAMIPLDPWMIWVLLSHLGIDEVSLLGHSQGGRVIREMYRLQPHRVWAYVNIDCEAIGAKIRSFSLPHEQFDPATRTEYQRRKAQRPDGPEFYWEPYVTPLAAQLQAAHLERRAAREAGKEWVEPGRPRPQERSLGTTAPPPPTLVVDQGDQITCPLLAFNSGRARLHQSDITPDWIQANIHATNVEYVVVTYAGHWIWVDQPQEFCDALEPFLAGHRPDQ